MLVETDPAQAEFAVGELLPEMPAVDGFALLSELFSAGDLGLALRALEAAKPQLDAELAAAFEAALHERDRQTCLIRRRASIREPDLRYLLAILLNAPTRTHALSLAAAHTPGRPAPETLVGWLVALSRVTLKLQVGGQPWEPNVLGLPAADDARAKRCARCSQASLRPSANPGHSMPRCDTGLLLHRCSVSEADRTRDAPRCFKVLEHRLDVPYRTV